MKAYVLVGFVILAIVVLAMISRNQREHFMGITSVPDINNRIGILEYKIADSDRKRAESEGEINSTLR
jgi:hypothetical protein